MLRTPAGEKPATNAGNRSQIAGRKTLVLLVVFATLALTLPATAQRTTKRLPERPTELADLRKAFDEARADGRIDDQPNLAVQNGTLTAPGGAGGDAQHAKFTALGAAGDGRVGAAVTMLITGEFAFDGVDAGPIVTLTPSAKGRRFASFVLQGNDNV